MNLTTYLIYALLLFPTTSMFAMETQDLACVPFNSKTDSETVVALFKQKFPGEYIPQALIHPDHKTKKDIFLLVHNEPQKGFNTLLGFIICRKIIKTKKLCDATSTNIKFLTLDYGQPRHAELLINKASSDHNSAYISASATPGQEEEFYTALGFRKVPLRHSFYTPCSMVRLNTQWAMDQFNDTEDTPTQYIDHLMFNS